MNQKKTSTLISIGVLALKSFFPLRGGERVGKGDFWNFVACTASSSYNKQSLTKERLGSDGEEFLWFFVLICNVDFRLLKK